PVIQTLSLNELREDSKFNELKKSYEILQNTTQAKRTEDNLILTDLLEGLDISIEVSTIKKITSSNYVSYTMLMVEPEDKSNNFSNLVIQEKEGVQRIFTVRYFVNTNEAKATQVSTEEYSSIEMRSGINSYTEPWGDPDGGGSGGSGTSGCEEYVTVCNMVNVWIPVPCGCGDLPGEGCKGSTCGP
ncbi:hypothetical protein VBY74_15705, partial [Tenacibaculum ascidiaceicola]|uniref:hypothetical protein n=1 Tax=Tenacibaculum ascidiaceicola TaxID=1699411 RepID=UPI0039E87C54